MRFIELFSRSIFPENLSCELCGRETFDGARLCKSCAPTVQFNDGVTCPKCGRRTATNDICIECKDLAPLYDRAASAIVYGDGGAELVRAFKSTKPYLKEYFADLLQQKCGDFSDAQAICFVPMTARAKRRRGFNQARLLAYALSKRLGLPVLEGAIKKTKNTTQQKSLGRAERELNIKSCFTVYKKFVDGKKIILVDDVLTTGATADAISALMREKGAQKIYLLTVASVEYFGK